MSCDQCRELQNVPRIRVPADLLRAISVASTAVREGKLRYEGAGEWGEPFAGLASGEPWGDFVSNYFTCPACSQWFHLHAETYHGRGGALEPVERATEKLRRDAYPP